MDGQGSSHLVGLTVADRTRTGSRFDSLRVTFSDFEESISNIGVVC